MSKFNIILREKNFFCLWSGQIISQFGDRLNQMALIALVYSRTGGSAFGLAKIMSFTIIPSFLISPFAGAYVDRWDRKRTMIVSDIIRAGLVVLIPLALIDFQSMVPLYIVVFLVFTTSCFFLPSKFAIIPELVSKEKLLIANSLTNTTMMIAAVLGIGLGGALIEKVGVKFGFYIDALTFLVSAVLLCCIRLKNDVLKKEIVYSEVPDFIHASIFSDIKKGIRYVFAHPYLRFIFATVLMLMSAAGALYIAGIVFIQQVFGSATRELGFLSVFLGVGFFCGALVCGRFGHMFTKVKIIFFSMFLSGIFIGGFAFLLQLYPSLKAAMAFSILVGLGVGPVFISANTLIHEVIKAEMRGRIFSSLGIVMNIGFLVFMFVASKLSEYYKPVWVIIAVSACFVLYGVFGLYRFRAKR